ncbi:glycoside hydrolase family 32 protein [Pontibacillus marinus]|uniref:Sucrose-6-phosphate hydrolase n=1 Tax=Pontibacillus marinus BH030004 = DSM 16465 TaxID=1385511 RepID=A0A0A5GEL2_9BACI|nr:sucrose-6-phosphate hydrolase [Pontibacillus marinus]KGX89550.1 sucrose-6-phosphate hydrolase [Pontibacillus marinus BH030004 = DSM 16465]
MNRDQQLREMAEKEVQQYQSIVEKDPYRQNYHMMPPVGLLNDPNGFIQWKGTYHMYFQWMPFDTTHGAKFWGHYSSEDLVNWELEPVALAPSDWYDKNGCYSGSAVDDDGLLKVFYTGNVKDEQGNRETYQCLAESVNGIDFTKKGPLIHLPEGFTPHFRDPKVWKEAGKWFMVVGAQTLDLEGSVALFESEDLENWVYKGELSSSNGELGYMWECPDLFPLGGQHVLVFCPQGMEADGMYYNNVYQSGYVVGDFDPKQATFNHDSFVELDRGFEFYAPQTTEDEHERRLLVGWMGIPDQNEEHHPTIEYRWIHNLTLPRELKLQDGKVYQMPVEELKNLRREEVSSFKLEKGYVEKEIPKSSEIVVDIDSSKKSMVSVDLYDFAKITYNRAERSVTLHRKSLVDGSIEERSCTLENPLKELRLFLDQSTLELFVNGGEEVFTSRMFPDVTKENVRFDVQGDTHLEVKAWELG